MEWREHRKLMDDALKSIVVPYLRAQGFKGSLPHFRKRGEQQIDVLGFQFSQWGPQFYVEIAVCPPEGMTCSNGSHYPAGSIKYYQCNKRVRIGENPFDFENGQYEEVACKVIECLKEAEEWWATTDQNGKPVFGQNQMLHI